MAKSTLRIIHTTDFHGRIDDFGKIAAYLDKVRQGGADVLYLDSGDICSGHPVVDAKHGAPIIALLNGMQLDAMAIGNHDFDYGPDSFAVNQAASTFPWLAANMMVVESPIAQPEPFRVFTFGTLTVGVVAVTQTPPATLVSNVQGIRFEEPLAALQRHSTLRGEVHLLIALTHVGFPLDCELMAGVHEYDLVLGGHSHAAVEHELINGTTILNTGAHAQYLSDIRVIYDEDTGQIEAIVPKLIAVKDLNEVNQTVHAEVLAYAEESRERLEQEVGVTTGLSIDFIHATDAPLGNYWTDALVHVTGAQIALMNVGGIRAPIAPGKITLGDIYKAAPFHNALVILTMTGQAITDLLQFSFSKRNKVDMQVSGITYTVWTDENGALVDLEVFHDGRRLAPATKWRVVTNDYLLASPEGYPFCGTIVDDSAGEMSNALIEYAALCMREKGVIDWKSEGRITVKRRTSTHNIT